MFRQLRSDKRYTVAAVTIDYIYFLLSCIAGVWQAWCFDYGRDNALTIMLGAFMGLPFALASYIHSSIHVAERPDWKRLLILWVGMPLSLVVGALMLLAETGIMRAVGYDMDHLPFYRLRLLIGEAVACSAWAMCLLLWVRYHRRSGSPYRFFVVFATLYAGVLLVNGFSVLVHRSSSRYFLVASIVETALSAVIVIFTKSKEQVSQPDRVSLLS